MIEKVLVTGAAGTIGSEVCRVLVDAGLAVIGLDTAETPLFWLGKEMENAGDFQDVVGSVTDAGLIHDLMRRHRPDVVVHAAALKHVGMCEWNVCEAVRTNLGGTIVVSKAAKRYGAAMVLVSTDKAVEPTTVMGATKAAAERWLWGRGYARIVRLVNILNSNGSLTEVVRWQIDRGGPVQLTDRRMTRMFMSIGDAATLIGDAVFATGLSWASQLWLPEPGQITTRRIADVIDQLIMEAMRNGVRVPVVEVGADPSEKLEERLFAPDEQKFRKEGTGYFWHRAAEMLVSMAGDRRPTAVRNSLFQLVRSQ